MSTHIVGIFGGTQGDLLAFDTAYSFLKTQGASRFFFLGDAYEDFDRWMTEKRESARGGRAYSDQDFLADISTFLVAQDPVAQRASGPMTEADAIAKLPERFVRVPEKGCAAYLDAGVGRRALDMLGASLCCVVHDKNDLTREDMQNTHLFIHGGEPKPNVVQIGPRYFVTPGMAAHVDEPACGLVRFDDRDVTFAAFALGGKVLLPPVSIASARKTKLSVE
ncbi:MAG: hypothetical protein ACKVPX_03955 [Myxococcaceae bacterium]